MSEAQGQGDVAANLAEIRRRIGAAAAAAGRALEDVVLVAVAKGQPRERVEAALAAGQRVFGENYVQEAAARWPALRRRWPEVALHMVGALQANKAREAVALFDVIESVDRPRLAEALAREAARAGRCPRLLLQVNTGGEPQKAGVAPDGVAELLALARDRLSLPVVGLMAIPPQDEDVGPHARLLAELADRHGLPVVSCGMSADFEQAIREGATEVRVGSAIFGARRPRSA
jgi:pyridoxal phosphate enzyme (YggS family)